MIKKVCEQKFANLFVYSPDDIFLDHRTDKAATRSFPTAHTKSKTCVDTKFTPNIDSTVSPMIFVTTVPMNIARNVAIFIINPANVT